VMCVHVCLRMCGFECVCVHVWACIMCVCMRACVCVSVHGFGCIKVRRRSLVGNACKRTSSVLCHSKMRHLLLRWHCHTMGKLLLEARRSRWKVLMPRIERVESKAKLHLRLGPPVRHVSWELAITICAQSQRAWLVMPPICYVGSFRFHGN